MNLFPKAFFAYILLVVCSTSYAINWVRVGKNQNDGSTFYVDFDSLDYQAPVVKYKLKTELPGPKQYQNYTYTSAINDFESNCSNSTARSIARTFYGQRSEPLGSEYTPSQTITLSESPNGIHTLMGDGLCQLNRLNAKQVNLSINQPWDVDLLFNSVNSAQTQIQTASKAIQKIGNYLIFPQNVSFNHPQPAGELFYKNIVLIASYNCTTEQRSGNLLYINYDSDGNYARPVIGGGTGKATIFTPFTIFGKKRDSF